MQRLLPLQNQHFGSKNKIAKNISKTSLQVHYTNSMQKTARKTSWYSRNETMLNICQNASMQGLSLWKVANFAFLKVIVLFLVFFLGVLCIKQFYCGLRSFLGIFVCNFNIGLNLIIVQILECVYTNGQFLHFEKNFPFFNIRFFFERFTVMWFLNRFFHIFSNFNLG